MPLALAGSLTAVQFRYPAELLLNLNKIEHFSKVSLKVKLGASQIVYNKNTMGANCCQIIEA